MTKAEELRWLRAQFESLLGFGRASLQPDGGAQWLDEDGRPDPARPVHTWITARMAHVYGLAALLGDDDGTTADLALDGLRNVLADRVDGGWFASVGTQVDAEKSAYAHAFVVLAAATGTVAGRPGADVLLDEALTVLDRHFWEPAPQMFADSRARDWSVTDPYRGANANMHAVEALLAAHDATGDSQWWERAAAICDRIVDVAARNEWRIPEHYDQSWAPQLEYNADRPRDPFKPYGSTPGHGAEWARLLVHLDVAAPTPANRAADGRPGPHIDAAAALFDRAAADGWDAEHGGFVYTVDWSGRPVEARRFHWVAAEMVAAAGILGRVTAQSRFESMAQDWWVWIRAALVDDARGSWRHELDEFNRPSATTWAGKPDIYHAVQAVLLPQLPLAGSLAASARQGIAAG